MDSSHIGLLLLLTFTCFSYGSVHGMVFTITLSHELAHKYYGQILTLYTFMGNGPGSISFELLGKLHPSARLYLFALGTQRMIGDYSEDACLNFYKMSIGNVSLDRTRGTLKFGSFTGFFPTVLVFADNITCKHDARHYTATASAIINVVNSDGQPLSGTLVGLQEHLTGFLFIYALAIVYVLYCVRSNLYRCCKGCDIAPCDSRATENCKPCSSQRKIPDTLETTELDSTVTPLYCCNASSNVVYLDSNFTGDGITCNRSVGLLREGGQEKQMFLLMVFLCVQFVSLLFEWLELSALSDSSRPSYKPHPTAGADGIYSHIAELLALSTHYLAISLLMVKTVDFTSRPAKAKPHPESESHCAPCGCAPVGSLPSTNVHHITVPAFSRFRCGRLFSPTSIVGILFCIQVLWFVIRETIYSQPRYAEPSRWPIEEQHGYWVGLGMPNENFLPVEVTESYKTAEITVESRVYRTTASGIMMSVTSSLSSASFVLFVLRTAFGLILSARLLRVSRAQRTDQLRDSSRRFGLLGCIWFLAHPSLLFIGTLMADHIRYKVVFIGVTLIHACFSGCILLLFTRQVVLWDISSLSVTLPLLKRIPFPNSRF
ncbi:hypothetical protein PHET_06612 [Paragonimus heterotremus]|uniref:GPR180/TMEM145 transmembrane domain-containing protein n=1 Tax=Paragonimus heterotremus TaxID=100268 RepID=A0A8J4SND4_9TREM|nr:hypothetical protein PHET_06612 [Paragonimus heterotremus]